MAGPEPIEIATIRTDPYVTAFQKVLEPSDETLRARGAKGYATYDEIRRDPHAFAVLQKRSLEVVSREWQVTPASERRADKKLAAEVEAQLKALDFDRLTRGLMGAVLKGFSVGEVIWENREGLWVANAVKVKKQRRFKFTVDGELRLLTREALTEGVALPERKFIVHRHSIDDDDDDPYGVGIGSVLFWPAWFKRQALAHWLRATERFAAPVPHGKYPGGYDEGNQKKLLTALRGLTTDSGIVTPEGVTIEMLEAAKGGGGEFLEALNRYLDELMSEAVLGETLTTNSGERGARSLGEVHNEIRVAIAKADADLVSATLKDTLVTWLRDLNFPGAELPTVWRDFSEAEDLNEKVKRDQAIVQMGYRPKDVTYIDETYGGEWVEKTAPSTSAPPAASPPADTGDAAGAIAALFAEPSPGTPEALAAQLETAAEPAIGAFLETIRGEVEQATSYADLSQRLLELGGRMGVDDLGTIIERAVIAVELEGRASVIDEGSLQGREMSPASPPGLTGRARNAG